jgi:hypothetical protein
VKSYIRYIEEIIVPYRLSVINALGLPIDQKLLLKHDLHFSHKDVLTLAAMETHFIVPLYVPANCTDVIQECDTVVNKPYKNGLKTAFRNYMHSKFNEYVQMNPDNRAGWKADLRMSTLKPLITDFVLAGVAVLRTPDMSETICNAFVNHGEFAQMRSAARQEEARAARALAAPGPGIAVPAEEEVDEDDAEGDIEVDVAEILAGLQMV